MQLVECALTVVLKRMHHRFLFVHLYGRVVVLRDIFRSLKIEYVIDVWNRLNRGGGLRYDFWNIRLSRSELVANGALKRSLRTFAAFVALQRFAVHEESAMIFVNVD